MVQVFRGVTGLLAGATVYLLSACGPRVETDPSAPSPEAETTQLEVVNRSSSDMDIYVARGGQRVRLGLAPGNETTRFALVPAQVAGAGLTHFLARPLGGLGRTIGSEPVMLRLGDVITLNIPPP